MAYLQNILLTLLDCELISELMQMKKYAYETFYELSKTKEYNKLFMIHLGKAIYIICGL